MEREGGTAEVGVIVSVADASPARRASYASRPSMTREPITKVKASTAAASQDRLLEHLRRVRQAAIIRPFNRRGPLSSQPDARVSRVGQRAPRDPRQDAPRCVIAKSDWRCG